MKIIDRYLLKAIIPSFLISFGFILFLLFMSQIFYLAEIFIARRVPFIIALKILFYLLPSITALSLPLAFMAGVLTGLARLSSDGEIDAMKALGLSPDRIFRPVFMLGLFLWMLSMSFTFWITPAANYRWLQTMVHSVLSRTSLEIEPGLFVESIPGKVIFVEDRSEDGRWRRIFLYQPEEDNKAQIVLARSGALAVVPEKKEALLLLENGQVYGLNFASPEVLILNNFEKLEQTVDLQKLIENYSLEKRAREKSIGELWKDWQEFKNKISSDTFDRRLTLTELNKRFSLPATCLIFVFLGVGLGWRKWPGGRFGAQALSLVVLLIYYVLLIFGEEAAIKGSQPPWLAMWLPNGLIFLFGLYTYFSTFRGEKTFLKFKLKNFKLIAQKIFSARRKSVRINTVYQDRFAFLPKLVDRYIVVRFLKVSILIFAILFLILILMNFFQQLELLKETQKPIRLLFLYIWYKLPEFILYAGLITILVAPCLVFGYLYRHNEISALMTLGISYFRVIFPVVVIIAFLSWPAFVLQDKVISHSNARADEILNIISDRPVKSFTLVSHYWIRNTNDNQYYHYDLLDPLRKKLDRFLVLELDTQSFKLKKIIYATEAQIGRNELKLQSGWIREFKDDSSFYLPFTTTEMRLPQAEKYFIKEWKEPANMTLNELKLYIQDLEKTGYRATRFILEAELRKAFSLSFLVLGMISLASVGLVGRRGFILPLGLSLLGGFIYWESLAIFRSLGITEALPPFLAAWGPQIIFFLAACYFLFNSRT
ncbi:MAG: LptF/LptG family permease [Candidatus Saccharicenans sp.]